MTCERAKEASKFKNSTSVSSHVREYGICVYGNRRRGGQYTVRNTTIFFSFFSISLNASRSTNVTSIAFSISYEFTRSYESASTITDNDMI